MRGGSKTMQRMSGRRRSVAGIGVVVGALAVFLFVLGTGGTSAALTGASAQKFCQSPTKIGDPVICNYAFINQDDFGNDETVTSLVDVSTTAAGPQSSGNILGSVGLIFDPTPNSGTNPNASPSCVG